MKVEKKLRDYIFIFLSSFENIYKFKKKIIFLGFFRDFFTKIYDTKNWEKNLKFWSRNFLGNTFFFILNFEWRKSVKNFRRSSDFKWVLFAKIEIGEKCKRVFGTSLSFLGKLFYLLSDLFETLLLYVKRDSKNILFIWFFWFFGYLYIYIYNPPSPPYHVLVLLYDF